jgi:hypothetical protein
MMQCMSEEMRLIAHSRKNQVEVKVEENRQFA